MAIYRLLQNLPMGPEEIDRLSAVRAAKTHSSGCLADAPKADGKAPRFPLSAADRKALRRFLTEGSTGAGSPAPTVGGEL